MIRRIVRTLPILALAFLSNPLIAQEGEGTGTGEMTTQQIVEQAMDTNTMGFQSGEVQLTIIIEDSHGDLRERRLNIRSLSEDGQNRALVRLIAPAEVAGQAYLFRENADRDDDIWIYLPALDDEPRRIAGNQKNESFMGTNITYADLESRDISNGTYTRLPDEEISGFSVYVIDAVAEDSEYELIRMWIRQSDFVPLRTRFFSEGDVIEKTMFTEQVDTHQGRTYVRRMTVRDREDSATTVIVEAVDFEASVDASEFTRENLTR
jgi:outer membrane lipoprotein-sorting protein